MNTENDTLLFAQESATPPPIPQTQSNQANSQAPWKLLVVDDDADIHAVTNLVLKNFVFQDKSLQILNADNAKQAQILLQQHPDIHLALIDVVMETENAGLQLINYIRKKLKNHLIRLLLRTGQPGQAPEAQVIQDYDINGYLEKTELSAQKLISAITTALRSHAELNLQAQKLKEMRIHAEAGDKTKKAFIANVSHEIRTPLTAIQGFADNLLHHNPTPEQRAALSIIIDSSKHLNHLLEDLINLSKLEAQTLKIQIYPLDFPSFITEIIDLTAHLAKLSEIHWMCEIAQPMPKQLFTDAQMLRQVLLHLLNNAIKFTNHQLDGIVTLQISYPDNHILFQIKDNGVGISTEEQQHLFQAFQQGKTRKTKNAGLGIGLTLSQKYLQLLDSQLQFTPQQPHGCCFSFSLRLPTQVQWQATEIRNKSKKTCPTQQANPKNTALPTAPCKEKLENLYQLAAQGYLQDIADEAERLHEWDTRFHQFADELRRLSENFEKTELCKYLKNYLQD